jgi:hypothetical protein
MLQRSIRSLAIPAALLSLLSLASPVHVGGWGVAVTHGDFFAGTMEWVARFLGRPTDIGKKPRGAKKGAGVDPDGAPSSTSLPICHGTCEGGTEIDPNG